MSARWRQTSSRHDRGYGAEWQKLRAAVLSRDNFLCQECVRNGKLTPAAEVDHVIPKAKGGTDNPANLQGLCSPCHSAKTAREANPGQRLSRDDGWTP